MTTVRRARVASFDMAMANCAAASRRAARALRRAEFRRDRAREILWRRSAENDMTNDHPTRRAVLATACSPPAVSSRSMREPARRQPLNPTPECHDGDAATLRQTEGPYFKPISPERADLIEPGMAGQPIELVGFVLTRACKPVAGALRRSVAGGQQGRLRQFRLPPARASVRRRRGALPLPHRRAGALSGPHAPLPRQGAAERPAGC